MIVVNTNILIYLFLPNPYSDQVKEVFLKDPSWAAPVLWRSEFRNVLAHYLRKNIITLEKAGLIMEEATSWMQGREYDVVSAQVLELVDQSTCSAYDCEFAALARDLKVPLITLDKQILAQFPETAISVEEFLSR